ncbi:MAG: hypothetical protein VX938_09980, partial [Myxococcota bacterium]|nr:hypothetical protein [Myxococcota bacterium]
MAIRPHLAPILLVAVALTGCASVRTLGPSAVFQVQRRGPAPGGMHNLVDLTLPSNGVIRISPSWFVGHLHDPSEDGEEGEGVRLQVVLRLHHVDGATTTWSLGSTAGDGAIALDRWREDGRYRHVFRQGETAAVPTRDLAALELLVAEVDVVTPAELQPGAALVGAAVVVDAPPPGVVSEQRFRWREEAALSGGGQLEMAVRLPLRIDGQATPGTATHWIAVVESEPDPVSGPMDAHRLSLDEVARLLPASEDGDRAVASPDGYGVAGMSVLMIQLRVDV